VQQRLAAKSGANAAAAAAAQCGKDDLPAPILKAARQSGQLNLSNRGLQSVPERVWKLNVPDEDEKIRLKKGLSLDMIEEDNWWDYVDLNKLILASNQITSIPSDIQMLAALTVLDLHDNAICRLPDEIGKLENLTKLNLNHNQLTSLPIYFYDLINLRTLTICHNKLDVLDEDLSRMNMLEHLDLSHNCLSDLPSGIGYLTKVTKLVASNNQLQSLPHEISFMRSLRLLDLSHNKLESTPQSVQDLAMLEQLFLQHNSLEQLPKLHSCQHLKEAILGYNQIKEISASDIENMTSQLRILDLRDNQIQVLPDEIINLQLLERLDVSNNDLSVLPFVLGTMPHLKSLVCDGNPMKAIRRDIIQRGTVGLMKYLRMRINEEDLAKLREKGNISPSTSPIAGSSPPVPDKFAMKTAQMINMSKKEMTSLPDEAVQNGLEANVTGVDLSHNLLDKLPENLEPLMGKLYELNVSHNRLASVQQLLGLAVQLQYLNLSNNRLDRLPSEVSHLVNLREVAISFNKFTSLPESLSKCPKLETILANGNQIKVIEVSALKPLSMLAVLDLSNNDIDHVPPELGRLTQVRSLQLEGNPFRVPRPQILVQGTQSIMQYLRNRIPASKEDNKTDT